MQNNFTIQDIPPTIIRPSKAFSPNMEKMPTIPFLEKLPSLPKKELPKVFRALQDMGVEVVGTPKNSNTLYNTSEVFNKIYKEGKNFNLKLKFADKEFEIDSPLLKSKQYTTTDKASGLWKGATREMELVEDANADNYKFIVAHEIGHSLGIGPDIENEWLADAFADKYYPGRYSYKNNPYVKGSWQVEYVPPEIIPFPKFPEY